MEGNKKVGSSSLLSELFGSRENSPSSSSGYFESIFTPPSKALGRRTMTGNWNRPVDSSNEVWSKKSSDTGENGRTCKEQENPGLINSGPGSIYKEQKVQPCHLSSSIFYGGQDDYVRPHSVSGSSMNSTILQYKKDGGEDDSGSASRGNWWQESLYY
ncbi:PREDICTED: uncharacterized protein LOC104823267 [Tarenaya hassleriana]|uniref:uncharacterized protein LOC104823267 n=1 Tax=Tarenaya hassleriana TaxID=28532 RepID=UPI00053CA163|nr:PREDICTED: uncharacterized protein LOC104823267 [Tarenaya hassleriana]